jgi:sulfatase modifying factor 1
MLCHFENQFHHISTGKNMKRCIQTLCFWALFPLCLLAQTERQWGGETLTLIGGGEFGSTKFGRVVIQGNPATSNQAWVPGLGSFLEATGDGQWTSPEYGTLGRGNETSGWMVSSIFGWTHFGPDVDTYGGWVWTERFGWMKFVRDESGVYLWVSNFRSWMVVNRDNSFNNFTWGRLIAGELNRFLSSIFGWLTIGDFGGWVFSDAFGWMWSNGDGTWFWSEGRNEWLGVTPEGGIWSTAQARFISLTEEADPFLDPAGMVRVEGGILNTSNELNGTEVNTFYIGRFEVTWGDWKAVRAHSVARGYDIGNVGAGCQDDHPVHSVNWYDALKWCNLLSELEGLTPVYSFNGSIFKEMQPDHTLITQNLQANGYRLPMEAEWEFAARGGNKSKGYGASGSSDVFTVGWHWSNSQGASCSLLSGHGTWPVGQKAANELGLYDMTGNVSEWCWDQDGSNRSRRGGSWQTLPLWALAVSYRSFSSPDNRNNNFGLRFARSSVP